MFQSLGNNSEAGSETVDLPLSITCPRDKIAGCLSIDAWLQKPVFEDGNVAFMFESRIE